MTRRRSSFCSYGNCVEVELLADGRVAVSDSKDPLSAALVFTAEEWRDFLVGVKNGEFDG